IALSLLVFMSGKKEHMLLNINRTTQLYKIKDDSIENLYTFLFQNTDNRDHYFYFEIDDKSIEIKQPKEPFLLEAGVKSKKIVILTKKRDLKTEEDLSIPITIKAFATDNKDEIFVTRDASFVYPGE
ncbi:MAG: FixG Ig-like domain-containing protein, partial [Campylobacterales bacterium]|nr:FixG Ig-like domain-containing protein [Campylobacterales bacterium]